MDRPVTPRRAARVARAEANLRRARAPLRIAVMLLLVPVTALAVALSLAIRTSDAPPEDTLRALVARLGCDAADAMGLAPARVGELGYHARNDPDGDGVACEGRGPPEPEAASAPMPDDAAPAPAPRMQSGGARFLSAPD